jgi:Amt family ammonium transporter
MMGLNSNQKRFWIRPMALVALALGVLSIHSYAADTTAVVDTSKAAVAAAPAAAKVPVDSALMARVADLEAYVSNTTPSTTGKLNGVPGPGHNAWLLTSTAFVLFMTLPGLALFYGGLVRSKNVLSVLAQCFGTTGMVTVLWWACGYSMAFGTGHPWIGSLHQAFLQNVSSAPNTSYSNWVSENVFAMFQLMFAIITPALIVGSIAERMKFSAIMLFLTGWMFVVYFPLAHMVWGADGMMQGLTNAAAKIHAIDFAGGTVVHMSSGWSALVLCLILGKRLGFGKKNFAPHSIVLTMVGTGMLWVGWYGFNSGSALAADVIAANAFTTTTLATAFGAFVWPILEWIFKGKPTVLGMCSGAVAGLVVITPACGYVNPTGAVIIGVAAAVVPYFFCTVVKSFFKYDDALDTFGVHGVGGTLGALLTGILASPSINANLLGGPLAPYVQNHTLWMEQLKAIGVTICIAVIGTTILAFIVKMLVGLRPSEDEEQQGLDFNDHGESGYHYEEA